MSQEASAKSGVRSLNQRWVIWAVIASFTPGLFALLLRGVWPEAGILHFLIFSYLALAYQLQFLLRNLRLNHRRGETAVLGRFGAGNAASMLRGLILALLAGFLFSPRPGGWQAWLPAMLYTVGDVIDYLDGYLARRSNHATLLGERMDMEWDAFGLLVATTLAVTYGVLPWPFLPVGLARYAFLFGVWLRIRQGKPVRELPPSQSRRPIAGLTMGYMSAMLWPIIPYPASAIAGFIFLVPFTMGFLRDWLVVSDKLDPESERYRRWRLNSRHLVLDIAPLMVRMILVPTLWQRVWLKLIAFDQIIQQFAGYGFPSPGLIVPLFLAIEGVSLVAILLGFAGRFAAFFLIFPIGFTIFGGGHDLPGIILLVCDLLILILGTGRLSLWKPSEKIFGRRAGEP